jgi:hypothetical protein
MLLRKAAVLVVAVAVLVGISASCTTQGQSASQQSAQLSTALGAVIFLAICSANPQNPICHITINL